MSIKIQVRSTDVEVKSGTSGRGKAYSIREQTGFASLGEETRKVTLALRNDAPVYAPGFYVVDDSSFTTDQYGSLIIGRLVLKPVAAATAASPAAAAR